MDEWKLKAACRGKTHIYFAPHRERPAQRVVREAQAFLICTGCPVRVECERAAEGERGIWNGMPEDHYYLPGVKDDV